MYTSIKGIYEKGVLTLLESAPDVEKAEVLITFMPVEKQKSDKKRVPGGLLRLAHLKGKNMSIPVDFNDPLEDLKEYM